VRAKAHVDFDVIVDVDADVVIDGAMDVSATFVVDRARVDVNDKGGAHVHGAVKDHGAVDDHVNVNVQSSAPGTDQCNAALACNDTACIKSSSARL
jgi:hypothetical protein